MNYTHKYNGVKIFTTIELNGNKGLNNPKMRIRGVDYNWDDDSFYLHCRFIESGGLFEIERSFSGINEGGGNIGITEILAFMSTNDDLKDFELI